MKYAAPLLALLALPLAPLPACVHGNLRPEAVAASDLVYVAVERRLKVLEKDEKHAKKAAIARKLLAIYKSAEDGEVTREEALQALDQAFEIVELAGK